MSERFYCDVCEIELPAPYFLLSLGVILCFKCADSYIKEVEANGKTTEDLWKE